MHIYIYRVNRRENEIHYYIVEYDATAMAAISRPRAY